MADPQESNVPVKRAIQETAYYCGAASTVMVLSAFDGTLAQDSAYAIIRANDIEPDSFYSDPAGVAACLDNPHVPENLKVAVVDFSTTQQIDFLQALLHNISVIRFPCPIMVNGGGHWVVVDGIRTTKQGAATSVMGAYVVDPYFGEPDRKYVPVDSLFQSPYVISNTYGVKWKGKLVTISDSRPIPRPFHTKKYRVRRDRGQIMARESPLRHAISGLEDQGFEDAKPPKAGAGPNALLNVTDLKSGGSYDLVLVDAIATPALTNLVYVAVHHGTGRLLEVATNSATVCLLGDQAAEQYARTALPRAVEINVLPGYFWAADSILRSRFSTVRKLLVDGQAMYLLPDGEVRSNLDRSLKGGG